MRGYSIRILLTASLVVFWLCASSHADEPMVDLIDAHGIKVAAIVPPAEGQELLVNLDLTALGRDLLLEDRESRPDKHALFAKFGNGDERAVVEAVGICWRWYAHLNNNAEFPANELKLPEFSVSYESAFAGFHKFKNHHGKCSDGYWVNFRKRQDSSYWWYDAGREFKGARATIKARLRFDYHGNGDCGEVIVDGDSVFQCKPGADTYEGEFLRRFARSRLWEQVDTPSFRLTRDRLTLLLGAPRFDTLIGIIKTHPDRLAHRVVLRPGPSAAVSFIKAIEVMDKQGLLTKSRTSVGGSAGIGGSALVLPGALLARGDLKGTLGVEWEKSSDDTKEKRFRVEYGELRSSISTERSAYLYLIALQQAMTSVRFSTPVEVKQLILGDVLAESVLEFEMR